MDRKEPEPAPASVEPDEEDEDEPRSTLPPEVAEREAEKAIQEIEDEIEDERPAKRPEAAEHLPAPGAEKSFIDRAWERQYALESRLQRIGHGRYSRVIKMARKPEPEEFRKASTITGIGIVVIGLVGFAIYLFMQWFMGLLGVQ